MGWCRDGWVVVVTVRFTMVAPAARTGAFSYVLLYHLTAPRSIARTPRACYAHWTPAVSYSARRFRFELEFEVYRDHLAGARFLMAGEIRHLPNSVVPTGRSCQISVDLVSARFDVIEWRSISIFLNISRRPALNLEIRSGRCPQFPTRRSVTWKRQKGIFRFKKPVIRARPRNGEYDWLIFG